MALYDPLLSRQITKEMIIVYLSCLFYLTKKFVAFNNYAFSCEEIKFNILNDIKLKCQL